MPARPRSVEEAFGEIVRGFRLKTPLSQEKLAQAAELSMVYVSEIERGKRSPSLSVIFKLAAGLGVAPYQLVQGTERRLRSN